MPVGRLGARHTVYWIAETLGEESLGVCSMTQVEGCAFLPCMDIETPNWTMM